jgi:hypothetical protein
LKKAFNQHFKLKVLRRRFCVFQSYFKRQMSIQISGFARGNFKFLENIVNQENRQHRK